MADTGIGIALEDQAKIFEEFTQVESPIQRKVKGTGLGLPLCRKLAGLLGGQIDLISEVGVGSTFSLTIPLNYGDAREASAAAPRRAELATRRIPDAGLDRGGRSGNSPDL